MPDHIRFQESNFETRFEVVHEYIQSEASRDKLWSSPINLHRGSGYRLSGQEHILPIPLLQTDIMYIIGHIARAAGIAMDGWPSSIRFRRMRSVGAK